MMAAKESSSGGINREEIDDITTCCICTEVYTDPKALPCIHTFCMKCIQETGLKTNKGPGDEMPCPICRRSFKIPTEGFRGLPKNFFIERLILLSKVSDSCDVVKELCSLCLEESEEQEGKEAPTADSFCVDCNFKLCEECCSEHTKFKLTKNHKLIPIDKHRVDQNAMTELIGLQCVCEMHEQQDLNVYCADCKTVVCAICFIEAHDNHKGSHVDRCLDGFRKQIEDNTEAINECIGQTHIKKEEIMKVKEEMQQTVESLESDVERRKTEIKQLTDKHASCLLQSLSSERQGRLKEIQLATDDIDAYLSNLESYNFYCQRLMDKGSTIDICRAIPDLAIRAFELQQQCQPMMKRRVMNFNYCFRQSNLHDLLQEDCGNLVGEIAEENDLTPRKRGRQNPSSEESNETGLRNAQIEIERRERQILRLGNELLNEQQTNKNVKQELSDAKAYYDAHIARLKQELDNNKIENSTLQTSNGNLKQELDAEKIKNNSLRTNKDKLFEELNLYKAMVMSLEINAEKGRKEPETSKADDLQGKNSPTPVLVHTIGRKSGRKKKLHFPTRTKAAAEEKKSIRGLTILDKELFVVSELSSDVEVYDSIKLSISRRWNLKEMIRPMDIGSCKRNKCLYIFDCKGHLHSNEILRVDPNGKLIRNWPTGVELGYGLSVTGESNVILTDYNKNKLNEYSPDGQLIREINLSNAGIQWPWHAIKLSNGNFVVSHGSIVDDLHRVCIVDIDGKFKNSFGGKCGSEIGHMNRPVHLSFDGNGSVMVVDQMNSRVLLLDPDLEFKKEILSKEKHGLRDPWRILLDESNGRLFVADNESDNQRIMTFDFK